MKKIIIYFIRHGEVCNPKKILYGRLPGFPLSDSGRETIRKTSKQFVGKGIKYIYTSPMLRTQQTAHILGKKLRLKPKISRFLIETKDIMAGISLELFRREIQPNLYDQKFIHKGQETIETQAARMLKFVKKIIKHHPGKEIIAVSHGDPIMILKATMLGKKFTYKYKKEHYLQPGYWFALVIENGQYTWSD